MGNKFDVGDVVSLVSSGPPMTVEKVFSALVQTVWFDDDSQIHRDVFSIPSLELFECGCE